jgi:hypothetical protein
MTRICLNTLCLDDHHNPSIFQPAILLGSLRWLSVPGQTVALPMIMVVQDRASAVCVL